MKFDKDIIIGIILSVLIVILWNPAARMMGCNKTPAVPDTPVQQSGAVSSDGGNGAVPAGAASFIEDTAFVLPADMDMSPAISNGHFTIEYSPVKGSVESITFTDYYKKGMNGAENGRIVITDAEFKRERSGSLGISAPNFRFAAVRSSSVSGDGKTYTLERELKNLLTGQTLICRQKWSISGSYIIDYDILISNPSGNGVSCEGFAVDGGDLENWSRLAGEKVRTPKHYVDFLRPDGDVESVDCDDDDFLKVFGDQAKWIAVSNKYFTLMLYSEEAFNTFAYREFAGNPDDEEYIVMTGALLPGFSVAPGGSKNFSFRYYAGPKISSELALIDDSARDVLHLAWGPLNWLSKLLLSMLLMLNSWVSSYGWSIIILTLFVRLIFWPVTMKANKSMGKMRDVKPKIEALKEKYKDNPQELNLKTMELYRAEGINPLGGCLPILLQIPVFIALYQTLEGAVQLRQQSFAWIADLSQPDTVAVLFGLPIHPLAIAMTLLMVLQQLLTPMSVDGAQRKMMLAMPVVMLFVLYNLPAGLTLYWTVSSIFSIGQMLLQRKLDLRRQNRPAEGKKEKA